MIASTDRVAVSIEGGVADVRLDRPEKMNALDSAMFADLVSVGEAVAAEPGVRAVVLSGEGRAFCAGLDFSAFQAMAGGDDSGEGGDPASGVGEISRRRGITHLGQQASWVWSELEVPVIAAVHGVCFGGGLQIALGADLRLVTADARLAVLEIRWGLVPDMTGTYALPRLVGLDRAKELTWTGREVSGSEAVEIGLATRIAADPHVEALALAAELVTKSPHAVRASKRLLHGALERDAAEQFAAERAEIGALIGSANQVESVTAFFARRDPAYAEVEAAAPAAG